MCGWLDCIWNVGENQMSVKIHQKTEQNFRKKGVYVMPQSFFEEKNLFTSVLANQMLAGQGRRAGVVGDVIGVLRCH